MKYGQKEGERCNRAGCSGTMEFFPVENCFCHLSPPCYNCVENEVCCHECFQRPSEDEEVAAMPINSALPDWMRGM